MTILNAVNELSITSSLVKALYLASHESESRSVVFNTLRLYSPWDSPGQNTGVGSLSLVQQIFLTQELNRVSCTAGRFFTS